MYEYARIQPCSIAYFCFKKTRQDDFLRRVFLPVFSTSSGVIGRWTASESITF
jgi:hypothetical protein